MAGKAKKKVKEKMTGEEREAETKRKMEMRAYYKECKGKPKGKTRKGLETTHNVDGW